MIPTLFALVEAVVFALFGVTHWAAQLTVILFLTAGAIGAFVLTKRWLPPAQALAVALLFMGAHEIALWGRQVMLDVPAYALLIWAAVVLVNHIEKPNPNNYFWLALVLVAGIYTKLNIVFILPVFLWVLWRNEGNELWRKRKLWGSLLLFSLLILPWAIITLKFGQINAGAVIGGQNVHEVSRLSLDSWVYYLERMPDQIGWVVVGLAILYLFGSILKKEWRLPERAHGLMLGWLLIGYLFFSCIALKDQRHSIFILFPLFLFAVLALNRSLPKAWASTLAITLALVMLGKATFIDQVPAISGYRQTADYVAEHASKDSVVLFSGYRDGSFIFNMRSYDERDDLSILRADKLLMRVAVMREFGVEEKAVSHDALLKQLSDYGVDYVVNEPRFWKDLTVMKWFQEFLSTDSFTVVKRFEVTGNTKHDDKELVIYRFNQTGVNKQKNITIELPIIGIEIEGKLGK